MITEKSVNEFCEWLKAVDGSSEKTIKNYRGVLQQMAKAHMNSIPQMQTWLQGKTKNSMYYSSVNRYLNWKKQTKDVIYIEFPRLSKEEKIEREERSFKKALSPEVVLQVLDLAKKESEELYLILKFCFFNMQRISAPLNLTMDRIDYNERPAIYWIVSKGERYPVADIFNMADEIKVFAEKNGRKDKVFDRGYSWVYKKTRPILESLGIEVSGTHLFRISRSTELENEGWSTDERQILGGWKSDKMPKYYSKVTQIEKMKNLANKRAITDSSS